MDFRVHANFGPDDQQQNIIPVISEFLKPSTLKIRDAVVDTSSKGAPTLTTDTATALA